MRITKKILCMILALTMVLGLLPATALATGDNNVYISVSYDDQYIDGQSGTPIAHIPVSFDQLAAINLEEYGLGEYQYDENGDGAYEITALHLIIYAHENLYGGTWSDVTFTGAPGSSYFQGGVFGFDENLNYYLNGQYPLAGTGWGATSDQIVLEAGDFINLAGFTSWDFYQDSAYGFHFFADANGDITHEYAAVAGTPCSVKLIKGTKDEDYASVFFDIPDYTIHYGTALYETTGTVTTGGDACASITFPSAGTWYLWADGGYGSEYPDSIVSAPGYAEVTVTAASGGGASGGNTDTGTKLKVTADEGITLSADISFCSNCMDVIDSIENVSEIQKDIVWTCADCGTQYADWYNIDVKASPADGYSIDGVTFNGTTYSINASDDQEDAHALTGDSYIKEKNGIVTISIVEATVIDDLTIHISVADQDDDGEGTTGGGSSETSRDPQSVSAVLNATMAKLASTVTAPAFGTDAGEWTVLSLARGGYYAKDNAYFTDYYDRIVETVNETAASVNMNGALHKQKSTENARLIVALSAIGKDATSVGNWDLVEAYSANGFNWIKNQGMNGTIWALLALDSNNYATSDTTIRQQCIDSILSLQHDDGGWALQANLTYASDPDITGMALTALYPYRDQPAVAAACEEAFACLSAMQHDNGTFASGGSECAESCAWVIVATTTWGINPDTDSRFIKNGKSVVDGLLTHYLEDSSQFQHIIGAGVNGMATDQACYALIAYDRFINGEKALFDYSDVTFDEAETGIKATMGIPVNVNSEFNAVITVNKWDNEAGYKLVDFVMQIPQGLQVTGVTAGTNLKGGEVSYNLDTSSILRCVYFDSANNSDITIDTEQFPAEIFIVSFKIPDNFNAADLTFGAFGMSIKTSADSTNENSQIVIDTTVTNGGSSGGSGGSGGEVSVPVFSAMVLYTGDGTDLIPTTKKAVAVAITNIDLDSTLVYHGKDEDDANDISFKYSSEISAKTNVATFVALVDADMAMSDLINKDNFYVNKAGVDQSSILFGDSNNDATINAQDALAAVDTWLRKGNAPTDDQLLTLNVNGDSRLNTHDALGIVEHFVNDTTFGVVTKAAITSSET